MQELGILGIKDLRIGDSGERRRVSIACELVTSPSILFLDEPTSGLDAYNAFKVINILVSLARDYNRTVVFTIHQPRNNIVALFDQLVVLAMGKLVYSGELLKCQDYFTSIGQPCPEGCNIADFLIDLTMHAIMHSHNNESSAVESSTPLDDPTNLADEECGLGGVIPSQTVPLSGRCRPSAGSPSDEETDLQTRSGGSVVSSIGGFIKRKTSQIFGAVISPVNGSSGEIPISPRLAALVEAYAGSEISRAIKREGEDTSRERIGPESVNGRGELPDAALETSLLRRRKKASWGTQFRILSGRAFKNFYRDPALFAAHYLSSIVLTLACGLCFHHIMNDIAGLQNRLGIFFFTLALFGFLCLSSLGLFANERILFMRERANGYYSPFIYFSSKILFDILPLRLVPPLVFGGIVYGLVGLVPTAPAFWKFMLTLALFNLTTASVALWLSIAFASISLASLVGTLVMLFNLMFSGLLINRETVTPILHTISSFHAAFEALAVNELRYLQLKKLRMVWNWIFQQLLSFQCLGYANGLSGGRIFRCSESSLLYLPHWVTSRFTSSRRSDRKRDRCLK